MVGLDDILSVLYSKFCDLTLLISLKI